MDQTINLDCLTWEEKLKFINNDGPYHKHPELVEKLKSIGILEYCEPGKEFDFSVAGAAFRDEVYQFVHEQTKDEIEAAIYHQPGKDAAFRHWLRRLNRNDQVPRGRFFRNKKALPLNIIFDELGHY